MMLGFPGNASGKEHVCPSSRHKRCEFNPWVHKMPWSRAWQPTPALLPGESHGQRSPVGYSPRGCKELDTTQRLTHKEGHRGGRGGFRRFLIAVKFLA